MFREPWLAAAGTVAIVVLIVGLAALCCRAAVRSGRWPVVVVGAGTVALLAFLALGQVDELFAGMYPLGTAGRGIVHISGDPARARAIVDAWQSWLVDPATRGAPAPILPITVAQWYIGIDSLVLVLAYSVAFGTMLLWALVWIHSDSVGELARKQGIHESSLARFRTIAAIALVTFALVPILDLVENGLLLHFIERRAVVCPDGNAACSALAVPSDGYVGVLASISTARWWVLGAVLLLTLTTAALWLRLSRAEVVAFRPTIARVRGPIIVIAGFVLLMWINPQTEDIFRGWGLPRIFFTAGLSLVLAYVTWTVGRRLAYATRETLQPAKRKEIRSRRRRVMIVTAAVLGILALTGIGELPGPRGLAVPAVLVGLFAWLERGTEELDVDAPSVPTVGKDVVPAILAAAWPVLLSAFALRSLFPLSLYDHAAGFINTAVVFVFWTVIVPGIGFLLAFMFLRSVGPRRTPIADALTPSDPGGVPLLSLVLIGLGSALWALMAVEPWWIARWLGGMGVILLLFAVATAVVGLGSEFVERVEPPGIFRSMNVRRLPIFLLLAFWLITVSAIPLLDRADYHDVRVLGGRLDEESAPTDSVGLLARWIDQGSIPTSTLPDGSRQVVPVMFIATDGGGIKAATWTALVLDCLFAAEPIEEGACPEGNPDRFGSVFAESGVSGGSFGLVTYTRWAIEPDLVSGDDWIHEVLGEDFVSPSLAWQLFIEVPRVWLQFDTRMDRAEVLERGWEQGWPGGEGSGASRGPLADGFRRLWLENEHMPVLLLNGFTVQDGCKFVTMPVDGNGPESASWNCLLPHEITSEADPAAVRPGFVSGSRTLTDILCGEATDVRMSTAALLSARFPFVSPSGRFKRCGEERAVNVVDGGYGDNSGAGSILELLASLGPAINAHNSDPANPYCIVPVMLQIQNGYGPNPDVASVRQSELTVPLKGIIKTPTGITVWQRNAAQLAVLEPLPGTGSAEGVPERQGVYALVHPFTHPGAEAPLGWTLSDEAEGDLRVQLHARANSLALQRLADFLDDPGTCAAHPT